MALRYPVPRPVRRLVAPSRALRPLAVADVPTDETLRDNFDRANGAVNAGAGSTLWSGLRLNASGTAATISSNRLANSDATFSQAVSLFKFEADFDFVADLVTPPGTPNFSWGIWFGLQNAVGGAINGYTVHGDTTAFWALRRVDNGTNVPLTNTGAGPVLAAGSSIWVKRRGTNIKIFYKTAAGSYSQVLTFNDGTYGAGFVAIEMSDTTVRWDDARGGPLSVTLAPTYETVIDDFNRADGKLDVAGPWVCAHPMVAALPGDLRVISNQLGYVTAGGFSYTTTALEGADCDVLLDLPVTGGSSWSATWNLLVTSPGTSTASSYDLDLTISAGAITTYTLYRIANGANQGQIGTNTGPALAANDTLWFSKRGSALKFYRRPSGGSYTEVLSVTDANHSPTSGVFGMIVANATQRWDNLRGGPLAPTTLNWSGRTWDVFEATATAPGPNDFVAANATVNAGVLTLAITHPSTWKCAQILGREHLGYGRYRWIVNSNLSALDANVVFGLFTYDNSEGGPSWREIDIEAAKWGVGAAVPNAQFTIQPGLLAQVEQFKFNTNPPYQCDFIWQAGQVYFEVQDASAVVLHRHLINDGVPVPGNEIVMLNLWLYGGTPPAAPLTIDVASFAFTAGTTFTAPKAATLVEEFASMPATLHSWP